MTLKRTIDMLKCLTGYTNGATSAPGVVGDLASKDPEVARFLASGMLRYMACRLGGECYCGKTIEERETVQADGSLIPALELCLKHWLASQEEGRSKAITQIREQWPEGYLVSDEVASESGASEDAVALLCQLVEQSAQASHVRDGEPVGEAKP